MCVVCAAAAAAADGIKRRRGCFNIYFSANVHTAHSHTHTHAHVLTCWQACRHVCSLCIYVCLHLKFIEEEEEENETSKK